MEINKKKEIIRLIYQYRIITGKELAHIIDCSLKTVQNTIKEINDEFGIIDATPSGYILNANYYISGVSINEDYHLQKTLLSTLLLNNDKVDIDELSDNLYISKATIERKFANIKTFLSNFGLTIGRHKNRIWLDGKENNNRSRSPENQ